MTKIPIPEVIEFQGWHEWNNACESMDDMADFAVANARAQSPLIATITQAPLEIQAKPMAETIFSVLHA